VSSFPHLDPDVSQIPVSPNDTDDVLYERARFAMPRIIADLARRTGEAAWSSMPGAVHMASSDKARMMRETAEAYERNLTPRKIGDLTEVVFKKLLERRDKRSA
jgi:hypothetical protein